MKASNKLQDFILKLVNKFDVDLSQVGSHIRLDMKGCDCLWIERIGINLVSVAHYFDMNGDLIPDPEVIFFTGYTEWIAISIKNQLSNSVVGVVHRKGDRIKAYHRARQEALAAYCDMWADNLDLLGWMEDGVCTVSSGHYGTILKELMGILREHSIRFEEV